MRRRRGRGLAAAGSDIISTLREKGEEEKRRGGRRREGYMVMCTALLNSSKYLCLADCVRSHVLLTFGNSNYGNTPVAAAFRPTKLRAWPSVCVMLHDNLFLTDIKWPRSKFYAKPQSHCGLYCLCRLYTSALITVLWNLWKISWQRYFKVKCHFCTKRTNSDKILDVIDRSQRRHKGDIKCQFWIKLLLIRRAGLQRFFAIFCA